MLSLIAGGRLDPTVMATHRSPIGEAMAAYDVFTAATTTRR
jgi:threonine dehydrogenase-like Zn-dependent dehydrogenase